VWNANKAESPGPILPRFRRMRLKSLGTMAASADIQQLDRRDRCRPVLSRVWATRGLARPNSRAIAKLDRNPRSIADLKFARAPDIVTAAVVTANQLNAINLTPDMTPPDMYLNTVNGDCPGRAQLHPNILLRSDARVFVDVRRNHDMSLPNRESC
jgi:Ornithine cyclodeaminase/mu-crystallin family